MGGLKFFAVDITSEGLRVLYVLVGKMGFWIAKEVSKQSKIGSTDKVVL